MIINSSKRKQQEDNRGNKRIFETEGTLEQKQAKKQLPLRDRWR